MGDVRVFKANKKKKTRQGKEIWVPAGYTVLLSKYEGELRVALIDERLPSGEDEYKCFEQRSDDRPSYNPPDRDDAPF